MHLYLFGKECINNPGAKLLESINKFGFFGDPTKKSIQHLRYLGDILPEKVLRRMGLMAFEIMNGLFRVRAAGSGTDANPERGIIETDRDQLKKELIAVRKRNIAFLATSLFRANITYCFREDNKNNKVIKPGRTLRNFKLEGHFGEVKAKKYEKMVERGTFMQHMLNGRGAFFMGWDLDSFKESKNLRIGNLVFVENYGEDPDKERIADERFRLLCHLEDAVACAERYGGIEDSENPGKGLGEERFGRSSVTDLLAVYVIISKVLRVLKMDEGGEVVPTSLCLQAWKILPRGSR